MAAAESEIRRKLREDFAHYAEKCLKIRGKGGRIVPLLLNDAQKHIHERLERQLAGQGRVRAIILKGRQQGCSTYVEARFFWKVTHRRGVRAFILTHLEEATRHVCQMAKRFYENCPKPARPRATRLNDREMIFGGLDSGYHAGTAKSPDTGRGATLQYFHGSEVAFWAHAENHMAGVLQGVADAEGTEIILESTSDGARGLFYKLAMEALSGQSDYELIFVPWFWQREYRRALPKNFEMTAEEEQYAQTHGLDAEQVCWRRRKMAELGGVYAFRREYPATVQEAFMADRPGALWNRGAIGSARVFEKPEHLRRVIVAVDPAVTSKRGSDETGIIVAARGMDDHVYIIEDLSGRYAPLGWAEAVAAAYRRHDADCVVAEVNQGGELVEYTLRTVDPLIPFKAVRASRGKVARAEPVAALDAQGRVHHVGHLPLLEDQMCGFDPLQDDKSPDRVDARVWAVTDLLLSGPPLSGPRMWR